MNYCVNENQFILVGVEIDVLHDKLLLEFEVNLSLK